MAKVVVNNKQQLLDLAKAKLMRGIESALAAHADRLRYLTTRRQVVNGQNRSEPGEYPARETGLLSESIRYGIDAQAGGGVVGVTGTREPRNPDRGGLPLLWLEDYQDRLGLRASFYEFRQDITQEIIDGATK